MGASCLWIRPDFPPPMYLLSLGLLTSNTIFNCLLRLKDIVAGVVVGTMCNVSHKEMPTEECFSSKEKVIWFPCQGR